MKLSKSIARKLVIRPAWRDRKIAGPGPPA
jgi:hypothetical protein